MKIILTLFFYFILVGCSFDSKSGIWTGTEKISKKNNNQNLEPVFEKEQAILNEKKFEYKNKLRLDKKISYVNWEEQFQNKYNYVGHQEFLNQGNYLKTKKLSKYQINKNILFSNNNIILSDIKGNIIVYSVDLNEITYKYNFYKKKFKRTKKDINLIVVKNQIIAADNLGYVYSINVEENKLNWAKNYLVPFRSNIKHQNGFIFLAHEDNKIIIIEASTGNKIDELYTQPAQAVTSFKSNIALDDSGNILYLNTSGNLYSMRLIKNKIINWVLNFNLDDELIFNSSPIAILRDNIIVTTYNTLGIYKKTGNRLWDLNIKTIITPAVSGNIIVTVTKDNLFTVIDLFDGEILFSKNLISMISDSTNKNFKKIKNIKKIMITNNKALIISDNSYLIEVDINNEFKITSLKKFPSLISDILIIDKSFFAVGEKNKLLKIY